MLITIVFLVQLLFIILYNLKKLTYMKTLFTSFIFIMLIITCSFNSKEESTIKDGLYIATITKSTKENAFGQRGPGYEDKIEIKLENSKIVFVGQGRYYRNDNSNSLLNIEITLNDKGEAVAETSVFEQDIRNKRDEGWLYNYKITIKKENLK